MTGIDTPVDCSGEKDPALLLQTFEGGPPFGVFGRKAGASDGDQAPASAQSRKGGRKMPPSRIGDMAVDIGSHRKGRVHQHHGGFDRWIEMIVDMRCIVPGDRTTRE